MDLANLDYIIPLTDTNGMPYCKRASERVLNFKLRAIIFKNYQYFAFRHMVWELIDKRKVCCLVHFDIW